MTNAGNATPLTPQQANTSAGVHVYWIVTHEVLVKYMDLG